MKRQRNVGLIAVAVVSTGLVTACGGSEPGQTDPEQSGTPETVTVYAAASLKVAFEDLIGQFETAEGGAITVRLMTDGSSTLAAQILEGAPADVFASADERNMATVSDEDLTLDPQVFTSNTLVIAMPAGNPGGVETLADLARVTTVLCAPEVPCGSASVRLLEGAGVQAQVASYEQNVRAVLHKVSEGEADAGIVYATDVMLDDSVESIVPPEAADIVNRYPITVLKAAAYPEAAQAFVDFILGETGQTILKKYGFGAG